MDIPKLMPTKNSADTKPLLFNGLNRNRYIGDNELSEGVNLSSENLPAISPREPREGLGYSMSAPKDMFLVSNGKVVCVDGVNFIYDGAIKGTVTAGEKSMVEFNGTIVIFPDKKYYNFTTDTFGTFTSPDIDYAVEYANRVFACKGNYVYVSEWGKYDEWSTFSVPPVETDSYETDVYSEGNFVGISKYQNHVVFFKDDYMYEMYGMIPSQYTLQEVGNVGAIGNKAIAVVNSALYFIGKENVFIYTGGVPRPIGYKLDETYSNAVLCGNQRKLYASIDTGVSKKLYAYDVAYDIWVPEDDLDIVEMQYSNGELLALVSDGEIYKFESGTEIIEWEAITKEFNDDTFRKKMNTLVKLRVELEVGSSISVYTQYNRGSWELEKTIVRNETDYRGVYDKILNISPKHRTETFKIKITGVGNAKIHGEREYIKGSER